MKHSLPLMATLVLAALVPAPVWGQNHQDLFQALQSVQRDVAQLEARLRNFEGDQGQKMAEVDSLIRQAVDATARIAMTVDQLEGRLTDSLSQQQRSVTEPIATLGTRVDTVSQDTGALRAEMSAMGRRLTDIETKLEDISTAVRTLEAPPAAPPANESADILFTSAQGDFLSGNDDFAYDKFAQFLVDYPQSPNAPVAQYYIGMIYDRAEQYDDAIAAFDAVLERYPENITQHDALFRKALALMKADRRDEARTEFQNFLDRYPTDPSAPQARTYLSQLGG